MNSRNSPFSQEVSDLLRHYNDAASTSHLTADQYNMIDNGDTTDTTTQSMIQQLANISSLQSKLGPSANGANATTPAQAVPATSAQVPAAAPATASTATTPATPATAVVNPNTNATVNAVFFGDGWWQASDDDGEGGSLPCVPCNSTCVDRYGKPWVSTGHDNGVPWTDTGYNKRAHGERKWRKHKSKGDDNGNGNDDMDHKFHWIMLGVIVVTILALVFRSSRTVQ